jgi:hypothetical protein
MNDPVNHPKHYTEHPSGVECIQITEHMNFCLGNAMKYVWRADLKGGIEDLQKAVWYINREIRRRQHEDRRHDEKAGVIPPLSGV